MFLPISFSRYVLTAFLFIFSAGAFAQCNSNDSTAPCFSGVTDILSGRQSLLQDDDLVVHGTFVNSTVSLSPIADGRIGYTTNSQVTSTAHTFAAPISFATTNVASARGRMFNLKNDQVVSIVGAGQPASQSANIVGLSGGVVPQLALFNGVAQTLYGVSGRFIGNGFDQMVFTALQNNSSVRQTVFQAIAAVNPNTPSEGLLAGPATAPINNGSGIYALTSGTFTDPKAGQPGPNAQLAVLSGNPANGNGLTLSLYSVATNLSIVAGPTLNLNLPSTDGTATLNEISISSGRFYGGLHDQLVIAYASPSAATSGGKPVEFIVIDFNSAGMPLQQLTYNTGAYIQPYVSEVSSAYSAISLQSGRFNWFGDSAQLAMSTFSYLGESSGFYRGSGQIQVFYFAQNSGGTWILHHGTALSTSGQTYHYSLAAGRFDQMQSNPTPPPATQPDPNLQLADLSSDIIDTEDDQVTLLQIYNVDPTTFAVTSNSQLQLFALDQPVPVTGYGALIATVLPADIQGRSVAIGPPEKATVTGHVQPDLVLGLPPMHVDWIPAAGATTPQVLNLSVYPTRFNTAYSFAESSKDNGERSGTTSYTAATKKTIGESVSYGTPTSGGLSVDASQAIGQMHKHVVAKKFNTYMGASVDFSTQTTFDDVVAASSNRMNIYSYRLIGQCVAAAGALAAEGCAAGTRPLYVQFSGPDNLEYIKAEEGRNSEWYQPVQEPGNLFSYPPNVQLLEADLSGGTSFAALTPTDNIWDSQITSTFFANWTEGAGSDITTSSVASHSFDSQVAVSANVSISGFDIGAGYGLDYNDSSAISTLNQATSFLNASTGIKLNRGIGGHDVNQAVYDYSGQSLIYGQTPPPGTIQSDISSTATLQTPGHLVAAHTADMLSQGVVTSGNFWPQAYGAAPDLAVNHAQRWSQHVPEGIYDQQVWFNCPIGFTSSGTAPSCSPQVELPSPANFADTAFYYMKGLFATPGGTIDGPTITSTTLGNKVQLRARIYNYSLAPFPAGTVTHVQFYAQPWDTAHGEFTSAPGNPNDFAPAIFIGEGTDSVGNVLAPVPAFCGGASNNDPCLNASTNNWEFAYATWDTSKGNIAINSTWKFWVVVWAENGGKLVTELSGHGLKSLPTVPFNSLASVPIETYSNNLGFYNQVFTILGPTSSPTSPNAKPLLKLSNVQLRSGSATLRDLPVTLTSTHRASGADIRSVLTLYYDGDPDGNGTLFDTQSIDRVPSDGVLVDTARFTPRTCGVHHIFVRAIPQDGSAPIASAQASVNVTIDSSQAAQEVIDMIAYLPKLSAPPALERELSMYLWNAEADFKQERNSQGSASLREFMTALLVRRDPVNASAARALQEQAEDVLGCLPYSGPGRPESEFSFSR